MQRLENIENSDIQNLRLENDRAKQTILHLNTMISELDKRFTDLIEVFKQEKTLTPRTQEVCETIRKQYLDTRHLEKKVIELEVKLAEREQELTHLRNRSDVRSVHTPSPQEEEIFASMNNLKNEILFEKEILRTTLERTAKLSILLESQKKELAETKETILRQSIEIEKLKVVKLTQDKTKEEQTPRANPVNVIPRSLSFSGLTPEIHKESPTTKPRSGSDLTRTSSSSFFLFKILKTSPRGNEVVVKNEKEISPRVRFLNIAPREEASPRKERPVDLKGKMHAVDEKPVTKNEIYRFFSQSKATGESRFKTLDKDKRPHHYTEYLNVHKLVKRNLTK